LPLIVTNLEHLICNQ